MIRLRYHVLQGGIFMTTNIRTATAATASTIGIIVQYFHGTFRKTMILLIES